MIDWISVDDVFYRWNGQEIVCETAIGYSTYLDGGQLDGLEITDSEGGVLGQLFVDFVVGSLSYQPFDELSPDSALHYSVDGHETVVTLSQLPVIVSLHDVAAIDNEGMDLWSFIANTSHVHAGNTENIGNTIPLEPAAVLDTGDNTLALILQNMDGSQPLLVERSETDISLSDIDVLYVNASIPDPLDLFSS